MTPPGGAGSRAGRMLQPDDVLDLVSNLGYRNMSWPALVGRSYALTAIMDGAPMTLRVDAYSGRVVDVRPLEYGRGPRGYYPPEAPQPGAGRSSTRESASARPRVAPLPLPRPVEATAPSGPQAETLVTPAVPSAMPEGAVVPDASGVQQPVSPQAEPQQSAPEQPGTGQVVAPDAVSEQAVPSSKSPSSPAPTSVTPSAPIAPEGSRGQGANVGAGVGAATSKGAAGTASVLSRPPVLETPEAQ